MKLTLSTYTAPLVIEVFDDQSVSPADKAELLFRMLFPKPEQIPPEKALEAMDSVLWDMAGVDAGHQGSAIRGRSGVRLARGRDANKGITAHGLRA